VIITTQESDTIATGQLFQLGISVQDPDDSSHTFTVVEPNSLPWEMQDTVLEVTPLIADTGLHQVTVQISDGDTIILFSLELEVLGSPYTPVLIQLDTVQAVEGEQVRASLEVSAYPDATLELLQAPQSMELVPDSSLLRWTPTFTQAGFHTISIRASNTEGADTVEIIFQVSNTALVPVLISPADNEDITRATLLVWSHTDPDLGGNSWSRIELFLDEQMATPAAVIDSIADTSVTLESRSEETGSLEDGSVYHWRVSAFDSSGYQTPFSDMWRFQLISDTSSALNPPVPPPDVYSFHINSSVRRFPLEFLVGIPRHTPLNQSRSGDQTVVIRALTLQGEKLRTWLLENPAPGFHTLEWDGTDSRGQPLPGGLYFLQMKAGGLTLNLPVVYIP
jgi:hypothetical protein